MTTTNRSELLRRIINPRNLLIVLFLLSIIGFTYAECSEESDITTGTSHNGGELQQTYAKIADIDEYNWFDYFEFVSGDPAGGTYQRDDDTYGTGTWTMSSGATTIGTGTYDCTVTGLTLTSSTWDRNSLTDAQVLSVVFSPTIHYEPGKDITSATSNPTNSWRLGHSDTQWRSVGTWTINGCDAEPVDYSAELSGSGTFCEYNSISFNASMVGFTGIETADYFIDFYKDGSLYVTKSDYNTDGYYTWSQSFPANDYEAQIQIVYEHDETTDYFIDWLNFTISHDCYTAFNGTVSSDFDPISNVTTHTITFDQWQEFNETYSGDSYFNNTTYYYENINNEFSDTFDDMGFNSSFYSGYFTFVDKIFDPFFISVNDMITSLEWPIDLINSTVSAARTNIFSSTGVLSTFLTPLASLFGYIFQIIPVQVVNLISVILSIDIVRVLLAGRKN